MKVLFASGREGAYRDLRIYMHKETYETSECRHKETFECVHRETYYTSECMHRRPTNIYA